MHYYIKKLKNLLHYLPLKYKYIKELFLLLILFLLGMYSHTIVIYLAKLHGNYILTHPIFLLSLFAFIITLSVVLEDYYPINRKILILQIKYEWAIFRKVTLPQIVKNTKKKLKAFYIKMR